MDESRKATLLKQYKNKKIKYPIEFIGKLVIKYLIIVMIFDLINITIGKEMVRYPLLCHANFIIDFIIFSYLFPHMVVFLIHSYKQVLLSYLH